MVVLSPPKINRAPIACRARGPASSATPICMAVVSMPAPATPTSSQPAKYAQAIVPVAIVASPSAATAVLAVITSRAPKRSNSFRNGTAAAAITTSITVGPAITAG